MLFDWKLPLLTALRHYPVLHHACEVAKVDRTTVWRRREADPEFAQAYEEAMEAGIDRAEKEAFRRAVDGFEEPLVHQGMLTYRPRVDEAGNLLRDADGRVLYEVGEDGRPIPQTVRKYSDSLLALVLKGRRKDVYAERKELVGKDGAELKPTTVVIATGVPADDLSLDDLL